MSTIPNDEEKDISHFIHATRKELNSQCNQDIMIAIS